MQPTSVAILRLALGGRRRLGVGRPMMASFTEQKGDAKKQQGSAASTPKKRAVAPHNLQHCVKQNLGIVSRHPMERQG